MAGNFDVILYIGLGAVLTWAIFQFVVLKNYLRNEAKYQDEIRQTKAEADRESQEKDRLRSESVALQTELKFAHERLEEQKKELEALNDRLAKEFEIIASKIVTSSSKQIQESHEEKLKAMLSPFKERIENFEKKVDETHKENIRENQSLKEQINHLRDLNKTISEEAKNLTSALKGDKKLQGDWGETKLERILQAAGLEKKTHYDKQVNLKDEQNNNFRPDYVIYLPDDKNLIIDSKVSLVDYERYFNAESDDEAKVYLNKHIKAIRDHITRLSNTNYSELLGVNSPDYVIMYLPIESALGMAMTEDTTLFEYALNKNIVLVSNNTLLATLKTVSFIWRQDAQNRNAMEIARQGGALYDKFVLFVDSLIGVGKQMEKAQDGYKKAMNQLTEGKGNLVRSAEKLKALGIKAKKALPEKLIERSDDE